MGELCLHIVTPKGARGPVSCDSVRLTVRDNADGKGGGSYGIRAGHAKAFFSLDRGAVRALLSGRPVLAGQCGPGFASVEQNTVTVVVEEYLETQNSRIPGMDAR